MPGTRELAEAVVAALVAQGTTVGVAESLTGGLLGAALTAVPGASAVFRGGVIAYATPVKAQLLGVPRDLLARTGPVDPLVARGMADGVRQLLGVEWGLSTTGVAGPAAQDGAAVGTVFVGCSGPAGDRVRELSLSGDRAEIRAATVAAALELLLAQVTGA